MSDGTTENFNNNDEISFMFKTTAQRVMIRWCSKASKVNFTMRWDWTDKKNWKLVKVVHPKNVEMFSAKVKHLDEWVD